MTETRECIVMYDERYRKETKALFHRFGDSTGYAGDQPVPITVAIVELEDGKMEMVSPDMIRFTDISEKPVKKY